MLGHWTVQTLEHRNLHRWTAGNPCSWTAVNHGIEGRGENLDVDEQPWNLCVVDRQRISRDVFAWRNHGSPAEAKLQALETELQLLLQTNLLLTNGVENR